MYGAEKGTMLGDKVKTVIYEIFEEYKRMNKDVSEVQSSAAQAEASSKKGGSSSSSNLMMRRWSIEGTEDEEMNSELDSYLSEKVDKDLQTLDSSLSPLSSLSVTCLRNTLMTFTAKRVFMFFQQE
ncbi:hypothetical protein Droror1_Dr00019283 [Drosera rotundifolia]